MKSNKKKSNNHSSELRSLTSDIKNINTSGYWNWRFGTKDWELKGGYSQTRNFAEAQVQQFSIGSDFDGVMCDFGCGAGDAFPVYRYAYPNATLVGVDFSKEAIKLCVERYGDLAKFYCGTANDVPIVDIIICSNVVEHLDDDVGVIKQLLMRCNILYVIVPYEEPMLSPSNEHEHVRTYNKNSFFDLRPVRKSIFLCRGWSKYGFDLWVGVYLKNIARFLLGRPLNKQQKQILFEFSGSR